MEFVHIPVLAREVIEHLACRPGGIYVDGTLGGGGHALEILKASAPDGRLIGIDRDEDALNAAGKRLEGYKDRITLVRDNFRDIENILKSLGVKEVDGILLDLGVSSYQFEEPGRGFSFRYDARLDMRMDNRQEVSAYELVNNLEVGELARIFREYGEEREAGKLARVIDSVRKRRPIETTGELANIIYDAIPRRFHPKGIHPATRVFQALRIAVNDELKSIEDGLSGGLESLKSGGRLAVISFHSLEDRIVKNFFREASTGCVCPPKFPICVCGKKPRAKLVTRKAVTPSDEEIDKNPRARSSKLRVLEKV